jgi:hypothetical protein
MSVVSTMSDQAPPRIEAVGTTERGDAEHGDAALFEYAPPSGAQRRFGLVKPRELNVGRRALLVVLVGWLPLVLLAIVQSLTTRTEELTPLLLEVGVHARYLIAAPQHVIAEAVCAPQLNVIAHRFMSGGIVDERDHAKVADAVASTRRLLAAPAAEVVVVVLAYLVAGAAALSYPTDQLPVWAQPIGGMPRLSLAAWWHTLVSLPLLLILIFGGLWRLALWTRLLWCVSRLRLRLVASHPDHCAGIGFLGHSVRAFAIVGMALAVIVAGRSAHTVMTGGGLPTQHFFFNIGLLVTILALFVAPLLVFIPPLLNAWRHGTVEYGSLANQVGRAFEHKWLDGNRADSAALEKPDFSATTDLYSVAANVYAMRFVPVDLKDLIPLAVAMVLPFVPVVLLAVPLDVIWKQVKSLLL